MKHSLVAFLVGLLGAVSLPAAEVIPPAAARFSAAEGEEIPDFQRHVLPVMTRMGCNGRACHGSFQGQGGFRMSLFGYDFKADLDAMKGGDEPRINAQDPVKSLILQKPLLEVDHDGGQRMKPGTWQHHLMLRWLKGGAQGVSEGAAEFVRLEVQPQELVFKKAGEKSQLRIVAHWSDGAQEDVTPLCRYRTNDDSIADVSEDGLVTCKGKGDTHIVAFYDNGVVPLQALLPVSDLAGGKYPKVPTPTKIDAFVIAKLKQLGMTPAELASDAEFLRRASLDVTGTLPTAAEVEAFLAATAADKRPRKIEELLARPGYSAWWATKLCDITGNNPINAVERTFAGEQARQWYAWIEKRIAENVPYDKLIEGIVVAVSRPGNETYEEFCERSSAEIRSQNPVQFAEGPYLPHYWMRRQNNLPKDMALRFAHAFLGVRLQCAECHKHPFDQWTKQDFDQFTEFFTRIGTGIRPDDKDRQTAMQEALGLNRRGGNAVQAKQIGEMLKEGKVLPFSELYVSAARATPNRRNQAGASNSNRVIRPKLLGQEEVALAEGDDPRQTLMDWMRQKDNPYFARAFVCRVWANYFGVGIVEPPDDQSLANPPSNGPLLDYLVRGFIDHAYDIKWLHREILNSRTYQLSWKTNDTNALDRRNFSHALTRRLPAELVVDALQIATAGDAEAEQLTQDPKLRSIGPGNATGAGTQRIRSSYMLSVFGKPPRIESCDCERNVDPSLLQTLFLRNDGELQTLISRPNGWVQQTLAEAGLKASSVGPISGEAAERIARQAYLRTVGRLPTEGEAARSKEYLTTAESPAAAVRDLLWAMLNTKEFILNH